jgi:hypothetical protein
VKRLVICEYFVSFVNLQQKKTTTTAIINGQSESTKKNDKTTANGNYQWAK